MHAAAKTKSAKTLLLILPQNFVPKHQKVLSAQKRGANMSDIGNLYDNNTKSEHGPSGVVAQKHHGPYGGKDNQRQLSASFPDEKIVKPRPKA